jgi:hypothetical protein
MFKSITLAVALFVLSSCKQAVSPYEEPPSPYINSDFPTTIGSAWTYAAYDSVSGNRDTVTVKVLSNVASGSSLGVSTWHYTYGNGRGRFNTSPDTVYVLSSPTVIRLCLWSDSTGEYFRLRLALKVGEGWRPRFPDSSFVQQMDTIQTNAEIFFNAYHIHQIDLNPNSGSFRDYWVQPKVGIVQERFYVFYTTNLGYKVNTVWRLVAYSLKP